MSKDLPSVQHGAWQCSPPCPEHGAQLHQGHDVLVTESAAESGAAGIHNDTAHNGSLMRPGKAPAGTLTGAGPTARGMFLLGTPVESPLSSSEIGHR